MKHFFVAPGTRHISNAWGLPRRGDAHSKNRLAHSDLDVSPIIIKLSKGLNCLETSFCCILKPLPSVRNPLNWSNY